MKKYTIEFIRKTTDKKILAEVLRRGKNDDVSCCAAENPDCPPEALAEVLRRGKDDNAAIYAACNPNCPPEVLAEVVKRGKDDWVSRNAARNPTYEKYLKKTKNTDRSGKLVSRFIIYKEIEIEHPRNWPKRELSQMVQDACRYNAPNNPNNWKLNGVKFKTIYEKVVGDKD